MLDIAKEITKIRKELNLTQVQFAKLIGIEQPYLSKIESGKNLPTIKIFTNLGYIMNVTVTKEENTVETKKSYPTSETVTLVFRDKDGIESGYSLHYRAYDSYTDLSYRGYTIIRDSHFIELLNYLERTFSVIFPTKTPKKVLLYFSSDNSICALRFYTNSNQYKSSSYVDIDLEPVFFSDSDTSHGLSMVKFSTEKEPLETQEELEECVETLDNVIRQQYFRHLDKLCDDDKKYFMGTNLLLARLEGIYLMFYTLLDVTMKDVKEDYFERYASLK